MYLIQLLLPLDSDSVHPITEDLFKIICKVLTDQFGGVTAFTQSPAIGFWQEDKGKVTRDEIVVFEVMADSMDRSWGDSYKESLESLLHQKEIVIRASQIERL